MATKSLSRLAARSIYTCSRHVGRAGLSHGSRPVVISTRLPSSATPPSLSAVPIRWHSSSGSKSKVYDFDSIKSLSDSPSSDRILIDVREPAEYEAGYIPTAINIPISSQPDALFLPADEFEDRFGFSKPSSEQEVVFYCKAGVRSSAAAQLAQQVGYQNVAEYRGSWLDWTKQGGKTQK